MREETGCPFDTTAVDLDNTFANNIAFAAPLNWGFQIIADPRDRGNYPLQVKITGIGNQQTKIIWVTSPQWHYGRFAKVEILKSGSGVEGSWFVNFALHSNAWINPAAPPPNVVDFPAASGGGPTISAVSETQNLDESASPPTTDADGLSIVGKSVFQVTLHTESGQTVTGGGIDIYRYDLATAVWSLVLQNVAVPTGQTDVGPVLDQTVMQGLGDRIDVRTNNITLSGAQTDLTVTLRVQ